MTIRIIFPFFRTALKMIAFIFTLRFRIIGGGAGIVGGLETLVYINNRGAWNSRGVGNFSM